MHKIIFNRTSASLREYFIPLFPAQVLFALIMVGLLPYISEQPQQYNDIIYELTSENGMNKSGELQLFWLSLAASVAVSIILGVIISGHKSNKPLEKIKRPAIYIVAQTSLFHCLQKKFIGFLILGLFCYYAITGVIALTIYLTSGVWDITIKQSWLYEGAIFLTFILACIWAKYGRKSYRYIILGLQFLIPLNLFIYFKNLYLYNHRIIEINQPVGYSAVIIGFIIVLYIYDVYVIKKRRWFNGNMEYKQATEFILLASVVTIFIFNSYFLPARVIPSDLWHHGEQITAWQQVFEQGQVLYADYSPASGLFPMVTGFILNIILDGTTASYSAAVALMMLIFAVVTIVLFYYCSSSPGLSLIVSSCFGLTIYNRMYLLLPALLVLMLPVLIKNRSCWLKTWMFSCFLAGLYYPAYGGALLIGTLPFGIVQIIAFYRSNEYREKKHRATFWLGWIMTLTLLLISTPLLYRMAKYILAASSQTVLADGAPLFGYCAGLGDAIGFLNNKLAGLILYLVYITVRTSLPAIAVTAPILCLFYYFRTDTSLKEKLISPAFLGLSSIPILLMAGYTFSLLRADTGFIILSRTSGLLLPIFSFFFILVLWRYGRIFLHKRTIYFIIGVCLIVGILLTQFGNTSRFPNASTSSIKTAGFINDSVKLISYYSVPEDFSLLMDDSENLARAGRGFMKTDNYEQAVHYAKAIDELGLANESFMNLPRLYYYLLNVKAAYTEASLLFKSESMQKMLINYYEENLPIVTGISAKPNYLLYRWLIDHNYKHMKNGLFLAQSTIADLKLEGFVEGETIKYHNMDWGLDVNSLGRSFHTLSKLFSLRMDVTSNAYITNENETAMIIDLDKPVDGMEYDYLYLEIETSVPYEKKYDGTIFENILTYFSVNPMLETHVREVFLRGGDKKFSYNLADGKAYKMGLFWKNDGEKYRDEKKYTFSLGNGKLLVPLGCSTNWLLEKNKQLKLVFPDNFPDDANIIVSKAVLLQRDLRK
jgi:hypothetical protein